LTRWSHDDTFLLSIDSNNLIVRWDPYSGQHLAEVCFHFFSKTNQKFFIQFDLDEFHVIDFVVSSDNKCAYLLNNHGKIKEFLLMTVNQSLRFVYNSKLKSIPKESP